MWDWILIFNIFAWPVQNIPSSSSQNITIQTDKTALLVEGRLLLHLSHRQTLAHSLLVLSFCLIHFLPERIFQLCVILDPGL